MATVQLKSEVNIEVEELIDGVSQLDTIEIEHLLSEISMILAQRKAECLPERESDLLRLIGEGLPEDTQNRYDFLQKKLLSEQMTPEENQELLGLIDVVEAADADRLKHLIELSQLRQITIDELMAQLGIQPPQLTVAQEKLSDFFRNSPLADGELDLSRDKSLPVLMEQISDNALECGLTSEILDDLLNND